MEIAKIGETIKVDYSDYGNVFGIRVIMIDGEQEFELKPDEPISHIRHGKAFVPNFRRNGKMKFIKTRPGDVVILAKSNLIAVFVTEKESINDIVISDVIALTANIDPDGSVWGFDTNCGQIENLIKEARRLLEE